MPKEFDKLDMFVCEARFAGEKISVAIQARADQLKDEVLRQTTPEAIRAAVQQNYKAILDSMVRDWIKIQLNQTLKNLLAQMFLGDDSFRELYQDAARKALSNELEAMGRK